MLPGTRQWSHRIPRVSLWRREETGRAGQRSAAAGARLRRGRRRLRIPDRALGARRPGELPLGGSGPGQCPADPAGPLGPRRRQDDVATALRACRSTDVKRNIPGLSPRRGSRRPHRPLYRSRSGRRGASAGTPRAAAPLPLPSKSSTVEVRCCSSSAAIVSSADGRADALLAKERSDPTRLMPSGSDAGTAACRACQSRGEGDQTWASVGAGVPVMWSRTRWNSCVGEKSTYSLSSSASGAWPGAQ